MATISRLRSATPVPGDGGQDLLDLKAWLKKHPETGVLGLACRHTLDPQAYGINWAAVPVVSESDLTDDSEYTQRGGPYPGYYAMDVRDDAAKYRYLADLTPVFQASASIVVYHLSDQSCDEIRHSSGLASDGDLRALKTWLDGHPEARPFSLACRSVTDPRSVGIQSTTPPANPGPTLTNRPWYTPRVGPVPGYFALDDYSLGLRKYKYFQFFRAIAQAGDSIAIYHIGPDEASRVRKTLGLPPQAEVARRGAPVDRGFVHRVYDRPNGTKYNYTVFVPADYSGDRLYPAILFLHGFGERGTAGEKYLSVTFPPALRAAERTPSASSPSSPRVIPGNGPWAVRILGRLWRFWPLPVNNTESTPRGSI